MLGGNNNNNSNIYPGNPLALAVFSGSLTGNRKQKNMCNFWPKKWLRSLKKFEWRLLIRELLKQYLTEE